MLPSPTQLRGSGSTPARCRIAVRGRRPGPCASATARRTRCSPRSRRRGGASGGTRRSIDAASTRRRVVAPRRSRPMRSFERPDPRCVLPPAGEDGRTRSVARVPRPTGSTSTTNERDLPGASTGRAGCRRHCDGAPCTRASCSPISTPRASANERTPCSPANSPGATSTPTCCSGGPSRRGRTSNRRMDRDAGRHRSPTRVDRFERWCAGTTGLRRSSTPGCVNSRRPGGCTTGCA